MRKLVVVDLSAADICLFEEYERKVVPLFSKYGGRMELCVRSVDRATETHVLYFPDNKSFDRFLSDSFRIDLQDEWRSTGALTTITDVEEIDYI